jgi:ArsR family transcriptional regulator
MPTATKPSFTQRQERLAKGLKALAHPARLAIVQILAEREECICGEIVDDLPLAQSTISQHLKALKEAGLVKGTIDGPRTCYCLAPKAVTALQEKAVGFFDELDPSAPSECC